MKIVLDVPEWAMQRRIAVFAGVEMLAEWHPLQDKDNLLVKVDRCNQCGDCCRGVNLTNSPTLKSIMGQCIYLAPNGDKWDCTIASNRPIACMYDPTKENMPNCSITYKKVPVEK